MSYTKTRLTEVTIPVIDRWKVMREPNTTKQLAIKICAAVGIEPSALMLPIDYPLMRKIDLQQVTRKRLRAAFLLASKLLKENQGE